MHQNLLPHYNVNIRHYT